jgi:hypothetical protein
VKKAAAPPVRATKHEEQDAPKVLLLPTDLSPEARILTLRHPRDGSYKRFLFCPAHGLYEFTQVSHPPTEYRSMLFSKPSSDSDDADPASVQTSNISDGYLAKDAQILVATTFDLCFLLLSLLPSTMNGNSKTMFQPLDDLFEALEVEDKHARYIFTHGRQHVEDAMKRISDSIEAADEAMYRISEQKTVILLQDKVNKVVEKGLPASMEERFVTRALETPVLSVKREESTLIVKQKASEDADEDTKTENMDSQSTVASSTPSVIFSEVSVASSTTVVDTTEGPSAVIVRLQRQRVALDFIVGSYLPKKVANFVLAEFTKATSPIDFSPLAEHMTNLAKLKAEALATRSLGDFSRKRGLDEEEANEERAEKKRKQEEEEKRRKANTSRGVKDLAKVNVTGIKKMSDFFMKKPATAKSKS